MTSYEMFYFGIGDNRFVISRGLIRSRFMYTREMLCKFPYFDEILKNEDVSRVTDSLTGVVLRPYIEGFIHYLIANKIPFTLAMLDLDNFKFINDTYGHKIGDGVLTGVSNDIITYLDDYGVVGRFGGDEFLMVNLKDIEYDDKKVFFKTMYEDYMVMRKNIKLDSCAPFITGTIGSATFPYDAVDYDELFLMVDKTLYRGKIKGRNCYIIYVESKHKNIEIRNIVRHGIYDTLHNLADSFDRGDTVFGKLLEMYTVLEEDMRIKNLFFVNEDFQIKDIKGIVEEGYIPDVTAVVGQDVIYSNSVEDMKEKAPAFYDYLIKNEFETYMIAPVSMDGRIMGFLMCAEDHNLRIWQDDECAILYFAAKLIAGYIKGTGQKL